MSVSVAAAGEDRAEVKIEPWGPNSLRVRVAMAGGAVRDGLPGALIPPGSDNKGAPALPAAAQITVDAVASKITNGEISATVSTSTGLVTFNRVSDGSVVLQEVGRRSVVDGPGAAPGHGAPGTGSSPSPPGLLTLVESFGSSVEEKLYGFGQHQNFICDKSTGECGTNFKDPPHESPQNQSWIRYDMEWCLRYSGAHPKNEYGHPGSHGGEVCLPWLIGASGGQLNYGFLWNMPAYGGVDFFAGNTTWTATASSQLDYFITIPPKGTLPQNRGQAIMNAFVDAVGHAPMLPAKAVGYWHSRNRYSNQSMLLEAAQGFHTRHINVSVIVIDYMHWKHMGDYAFDRGSWPDVAQMMQNLSAIGMEVMVSAWPFQAVNSSSIDAVKAQGLALTANGTSEPVWWNDNNCHANCYCYDPTQKKAREFVWSKLSSGYYKHGIKIFWLDAAEPEVSTADAIAAASSYNNSQGLGQSVGMMFPYNHARTVHDGLVSEGEQDGEIILLTRAAWAGMQRWGAALWSGDTVSTFACLKTMIQAGLHTQMSGIAWWTTDIGGYGGGNPDDPSFRELIGK